MRPRFPAALTAIALLLLTGACAPGTQSEPVPPDPAVAELTALGERLIAQARAGDADGVAATLAGLAPTAAELSDLFGAEAGTRLFEDYSRRVLPALQKESGPVLVAEVARGVSEVRVEAVGPAFPGRTTPGDHRQLEAMRRPHRMYTVRLHRTGETLGLRFNGLVEVDGRWRMLATVDPSAPTPGEPSEPPPSTP